MTDKYRVCDHNIAFFFVNDLWSKLPITDRISLFRLFRHFFLNGHYKGHVKMTYQRPQWRILRKGVATLRRGIGLSRSEKARVKIFEPPCHKHKRYIPYVNYCFQIIIYLKNCQRTIPCNRMLHTELYKIYLLSAIVGYHWVCKPPSLLPTHVWVAETTL